MKTVQQEHAIDAPRSTSVAPVHFVRAAGAAESTATISAFADQVTTALADHPHLTGRRLRIEAHAGRVTLHGVVSSYYQKQMAQEALRGLDGVREIENRLEVTWS